ncbi:MAG: MarR family transcriptional regulator [Chloroherpetonaceae bacterium]|nr:MarR family transcriptional regulator [Chthonomonadaceae bacterium]MDW8207015.1 MarR family transcriptional regulator [Chloroherpetonaceae bacterium]
METERALHLFRVLARCARSVMEHARQDIVAQGMKPTEFAVMELLYHRGPTPLGDIARRILLTTGGVTHVIDQLEKRQWIRRVPCEKDRRVLFAELTEAGRQKMDALFPAHAERIVRAVSALDPTEQLMAIQLLRKLGLGAQALLEQEGGTRDRSQDLA